MDLLLSIVEANATAKALASVAAQSLHAVDDCSCITECCTKVLPAALSALESAASSADDVVGQAVECVQGCNAAMTQLQIALEGLNSHDSEGVLGILLEHPAAWLDTYRAFRALTGQLVGLSCLVRAAAQRGQADESDEELRRCVKALTGICSRAREAANLLGCDLPELARTATAAGWSPRRLRCGAEPSLSTRASTAASGGASPCRGCSGGRRSCSCGSAAPEADVLASASSALQRQQQQQQQVPFPQQQQQQQQQQQRMSLLRRLGKAAACGSPVATIVRRGCGGGAAPMEQSFTSGTEGSGHGLEEAASALVGRIIDTILYDSEIDQLEQDRTYIRQRVAHLTEFSSVQFSGNGSCTTAAAAAAAAAVTDVDAAEQLGTAVVAAVAAATASLIQSEILLAAVDAKLAAMAEGSNVSGDTCRQLQSGGQDIPGCGGGGGSGGSAAVLHARVQATASGRLVDPDDLYDDVRKRRTGLRWLPVCFVGA